MGASYLPGVPIFPLSPLVGQASAGYDQRQSAFCRVSAALVVLIALGREWPW